MPDAERGSEVDTIGTAAGRTMKETMDEGLA